MTASRFTLFLLRVGMGVIFLYAGITKIMDASWSSAGFISSAQTFPELYAWFGTAANLPIVDFMVQWGMLAIGISLVVGALTRISSFFGIVMMLLLYFPTLNFPLAGAHSYVVDQHIIYALVLLLFITTKAGRFWGLDKWLAERRA